MDNVSVFGRIKKYTAFGGLLRDVAEENRTMKNGIVVLFEDDGSIKVLPVCSQAQCAFAAADLLNKAAQ